MFNSKAQTSAPFRLMIGMIMGLLILAIIISAITYFDQIKVNTSFERLKNGFNEAVDNIVSESSNEIVTRENLLLDKTVITSKYLVQGTEVQADCVEFQASQNNQAFELMPSSQGISITQRINVTVYFKCTANSNACSIYCIVGFGKQPQ